MSRWGAIAKGWQVAASLLVNIAGVGRGAYDPVLKLESARLYGNIASYAYYYVDLTIGTPAQRVSVILDTGSGLLAFPCIGCPHCGKHIDPLFDISKSSTAKWIPCGSSGNTRTTCHGKCSSGHCTYRQAYLEGSSISGYWFEDFVRLGDTIQHNPPILAPMGCHQNENKLFYTQKANGIFGIQGAKTLLNDLFRDSAHVDSRVFSICLAAEGGRLTVGGANNSYHTGEVGYTNQIGGGYGVRLNKVTVQGSVISGFRSTMIDSGTTYTFLPRNQYKEMKNLVEKACSNNGCKASRARAGCWSASNGLANFPSMDFQFEGVTVKWNPREYLYKTGPNTYCYAFKDDGSRPMTTLGATWMLYKDVIFDLAKKRIGMVAAECPEYKVRPAHTVDPPGAVPATAPPARQPAPAASPAQQPAPAAPPAQQPALAATPVTPPAPAPVPSELPRAWPSPQSVPWKSPDGNATAAAKRAKQPKWTESQKQTAMVVAGFLALGALCLLPFVVRSCMATGRETASEHEREGMTAEAEPPAAVVVGHVVSPPDAEEASPVLDRGTAVAAE